MIRPFEHRDLEQVLLIWLNTNRLAHDFIPSAYWESRREAVKGALPQAELYVWEENGEILGFIGLEDCHIAGIFVRQGAQSKGVGKQLLDRAKAGRDRLTLCVYRKNARAAAFYRREGFALVEERTDGDTGEAEYLMAWKCANREEPF